MCSLSCQFAMTLTCKTSIVCTGKSSGPIGKSSQSPRFWSQSAWGCTGECSRAWGRSGWCWARVCSGTATLCKAVVQTCAWGSATLRGSWCCAGGRTGCMRAAQTPDRGGFATWSAALVLLQANVEFRRDGYWVMPRTYTIDY